MDKPAIRRDSFQRIRSIPASERERRSLEICERIAALTAFAEAETVYAYLALPSEPCLAPLMGRFPGKRWAVPRVDPASERLSFHLLPPPGATLRGPHGILEPAAAAPAAPPDPSLVLVPGVAFDPGSGARLGRGKGHYDRFLSYLRGRRPAPRFVGVCFREQLRPLSAEAHDIPMHELASA